MTAAQGSFTFSPLGAQPELPTRRNLVIEAGAGTGKTTRIVAEVLRLMLTNAELDPERIVLVTFTEKAAGEIADRIREALRDLASRIDDPLVVWPKDSAKPLLMVPASQREEWKRACFHHLDRIDSLRSQTIHSFCQSLLRLFPIEANLDPQFKIVEGFERSLLHEELYDAWIDLETRTVADPEHLRDWEVVFEQFNYLFQIHDMLFALVDRRDLLGEPLSLGSIDEVDETLRTSFAAVAATNAERIVDRELLRLIEHARREPLPPPEAGIESWLEFMRPIASPMREANLPKGKQNEPCAAAIRALRATSDGNKGDKCIYDRLVSHRAAEALMRIARRFVEFLEEEKRKLGVADFDDLLLRTADLLEDESILARARSQFDYIFVDEFQDTDRTQARILTRLCTDARGEWVPGRTIVVGDPKQSIYGFRRADPETYARMTQAMIAAGAERDEIRDQYRSDPPLLDAINALFVELFGGHASDPNVFRPRYGELRAGRAEEARKLDARVTFLHAAAEENDLHRQEAESIAGWIEKNRDGSERDLQRFAILFRRTTKLDDYLDVLDRRGIDYVLPPTRMFLDRRTAVDLIAMLRAIAYPFDRGAQISAARTPYFGLTDEEIAVGVLAAEEEEPSDATEPWRRFAAAMASYRNTAAHVTVSQLIAHVVAESGIETIFGATAEHQRAMRHLEHLRAIAFTFDTQKGGSLRQFVDQISMRRNDPDEMEPSLTDETRNAVRILTIHAAKGLEFDTVILPDLEFAGGSGGSLQVFATDAPESLVISGQLESISGNFRYTPAGETLKKVASRREEAEMQRLFYVAVTRARSEVVLVMNCGDKVKNTGFRKLVNGVFGLDPKTPLPFGAAGDRVVRALPVGTRSVDVAFERIDSSATAAASRRRLVDEALEEQLAGGALTPPEIVTPTHTKPQLSPRDAARLRTGRTSREGGILLHRVLELWDGSSDPEALLRQLAVEVAAEDRTVSAVRQRVATLRRSGAFARVMGAELIGREVPIRIADATGKAIERRIDRLVRENGNEVVVDYKSGRPDPKRLESDSAQVRSYCEAITRMTGRPCTGLLWYVDLESDVVVEMSAL